MTIHTVRAELFHADRQTDMTKLVIAFRSFVKVPKNSAFFPQRICAFNHLTPNDHFSGRTAPLTSRCCIFFIYSTNIRTEYFKHAA